MKRLLLLLFILPICAWGQVITTVAGNGSSAYSGDGGPATIASLNPTFGGAFDSHKNYYFLQGINSHRIRMIDSVGIIHTIVGTGVAGFSGDTGPAILAQLNYPTGIAIDKYDNLYISDYHNYRIRKVDANTHIITTIAGNGIPAFGGEGVQAITTSIIPSGSMCVDTFGNIYFSDSEIRVRKISTTGIINTVAGNLTGGYSGDNGLAINASLTLLHGLAFDNIGDLYISCSGRIRKVNINSGIITTFAGNGTSIFNGDGIPAINAGFEPWGIVFDSVGNLFIADYLNRIRKIDVSNDNIYTIVGNGIAGFSGDNGPAVSAQIHFPEGIAFDKCGNLYIADEANFRIRKVWIVTTTIPSANITVSPNNTICAGATVTFTTTPVNAGAAPTYQWLKNGIIMAGATNTTYSYTPNNGDSVQCIVVSSVPCAGPTLSNAIHMSVTPTVTPSISISAQSSSLLGNMVTVTATVANAGSNYMIHWMNHGIEFATTNVPPASGNSTTYTKGAGTDSITAKVVVTGVACADSTTTNTYITVTASENINNVVNDIVQVYPNPTNNILHVDNVKNKVKYRLLNVVGQCVQTDTFLLVNNIILLQGIPTGIYLLELTQTTGQREVVRVVKGF